MAYSEKDIERLKRDVPSWKVVAERVSGLRKKGTEYECLCPFHQETTPSFKCFVAENGIWLWKCFGCALSGNAIQFVERYDRISFSEAVDKVASVAGWQGGREKVESAFQEVIGREEKKLTFPLAKLAEAERALQESPAALAWLKGRGLTLEIARRFHLGYVQSAAAVNPNHEWVGDGWIVFPTIEGETITLLKYRSVRGKRTPSGESGILRKGGMATHLFNARAVESFDDVFVVEGEPDCMVMVQAGYPSVALPMAGFSPTPEMKDRLMQANMVYLAGDMDPAGRQAMHKLWTELRDRTYLVEWPEGCKDANDCFLKVCGGDVARFREAVEALKARAHERPVPFMYSLRETLRHADSTPPSENPARLRFPWPSIDRAVAVLPTDLMCMFATEPKTGKTGWLMNILLENAVRQGRVVVNFSAELSPEQYARRAAAHLLRRDKDSLSKEDFLEAANLMGEARFYNGYKPGANYREVVDLVLWAKRRLGADIIAIDHLHFLTRSERDETKAQSEALRMLKDLAIEYNVVVIVVGQPRKPQANMRGREAVAQDAKGSEAFGSDASQLFILHRSRKQGAGDDDVDIFEPETRVKLDYSRESGTWVKRLFFNGAQCTFYEMARERE